jgi:ABC-type multidrug transport system fused ATPase/permease subunit
MLLNRKNISLFDYGRLCFFLNSVFNHYINSIERTEIKIASSEKTNTQNRDTIADFVNNQNIIYNCSQEEQFLSKIMRSYNDVNHIDTSYYKDCLITPEHYNNETLYYEQLAMLRFFVKLEPFDIHVLELIRYYLRLVTLYSIQLRDISNRLNNLEVESLKDFSFKSTTIIGEPDYKNPLFTIERMVFSHNKNDIKSCLFELDTPIRIPASKWIYFKGNSGTGKTTLIQLLLRMITNNNTKFFQYDDYDMNSIRKYIIFVKSSGDIFTNETVEYNVTFGITNPPLSILQHYFTLFEIGAYEDIKDKVANTLSTGEKQRIRIIHTILQLLTDNKKKVLILDEITSNIDETVEATVISELRRLQKEHALSVIHISHSSGHVKYGDLLMTIDNRRLRLSEL